MLKRVVIVLGLLVVGLLAVIAMRPDTFHVERSMTFTGPPAAAFGMVNDFHQWPQWSPWEKLDPGIKRTFGGSPAGMGALYSWTGNDKVGEGRMTITGSQPSSQVDIKLEFIKPWQATNATTFTFAPQGAETKVVWAMDGQSNFMSKAIGLVWNMDSLVGKDFERGLAQMKSAAEAATANAAAEAARAAAAAAAANAAAAEAAAKAAVAAAPPVAAATAAPAAKKP
jgi:hypothetical protein